LIQPIRVPTVSLVDVDDHPQDDRVVGPAPENVCIRNGA